MTRPWITLLIYGLSLGLPCFAAADEKKLPSLSVVEEVARRHFAELKKHGGSNLLTQRDVEPLLRELSKLGFPVREREQGIQVVLPDSHPLVSIVRSRQGSALVAKLSDVDAAYARFDRLAAFPDGYKLLHHVVAQQDLAMAELICTPDFARTIELRYYNDPRCQNFDSSSGRAYTASQYLEHLKTMHLLAEKKLSRPGD